MAKDYRLSPRGQSAIVREEAIVLFVYEDKDTKGVIHRANGVGNNDDSMAPDARITVEEAIEKFHENIKRFEAVVSETITRDLNEHEADALISRAFNSGVTGFRVGQAKLIQAVNNNDIVGVVWELAMAGNKKRRRHEADMYHTGRYIDFRLVPLFEVDLKHRRMIPNPIQVP
jgi:GH24 family phage-related lysozyme (muramidase)